MLGEDSTGLALADAENFGTAFGASALGSRSFIFQRDCLRIRHFNFLPAFHAISLHNAPPSIIFA
jgi:hypothetical protein